MSCEDKTVDLQGVVMSLNPKLWCFELERDRTVYMPHLAAFSETATLPAVGSNVKIEHAHFQPIPAYFIIQEPKVYYLCPDSRLNSDCSSIVSKEDSVLLKLVKQNALSITEFQSLLFNIKNNCGIVCESNVEDFTFEVYKTAAVKSRKFSDVVFKTISKCKYVDSKINCGGGMPYWSFGCHPSKRNEILIGFFKICANYGLFLLSDDDYDILCIVKRNNSDSLLAFVDKYVIVTKYIVFTELFRDYARGIDYLICDINDIKIVDFLSNKQQKQLKYNVESQNTTNRLRFLLQNKSMPMLTMQNKPYFWLQVLDDHKNKSYLSLHAPHMHLFQFLQIGCVYNLFYDKPLTKTQDVELKRLDANCLCYKLEDASAVIKFETKEFDWGEFETKESVLCGTQTLISLKGVLIEKDFCKALSSRTKRNVSVAAFGTPGGKTHFLKLKNCKNEIFTLYLNNWEAIQMPFGLLPNMKVLVRNVLPQKGKYYKSTILTNFELLSYEPKIDFETANLCSDTIANWGTPCSKLSYGYLIPNAILIYSQIATIKIRSLKISRPLQLTMTLLVNDAGGRAMLICKSLELLRVLLDIPESQWGDFCGSLQKIDSYQYDRYYFENNRMDLTDFTSVLTAAVNVINEIGLCDVEMLCRKLSSKLEDNDRLPLWLCVAARKQ